MRLLQSQSSAVRDEFVSWRRKLIQLWLSQVVNGLATLIYTLTLAVVSGVAGYFGNRWIPPVCLLALILWYGITLLLSSFYLQQHQGEELRSKEREIDGLIDRLAERRAHLYFGSPTAALYPVRGPNQRWSITGAVANHSEIGASNVLLKRCVIRRDGREEVDPFDHADWKAEAPAVLGPGQPHTFLFDDIAPDEMELVMCGQRRIFAAAVVWYGDAGKDEREAHVTEMCYELAVDHEMGKSFQFAKLHNVAK